MKHDSTTRQAIKTLHDEWGFEPAVWANDQLIDVASYSAKEIAEWDGIDGYDAEYISEYTVHFTRQEGTE